MKNEELDNIITLNDEDGNAVDFEFLDLIEYKGGEYVVLFPADADDDADFVILGLERCEDEELEMYVGIDDEETIMAVFEIFKDRVNYDLDTIE